MGNLFDKSSVKISDSKIPLAERLRPRSLNDVLGQQHILSPNSLFRNSLKAGTYSSVVFYGPPGTGKTTIARLLAEELNLAFEELSALSSGISDLRKVYNASKHRLTQSRGTLLFVDELHRFNKSQQDSLFPFIEDGTIVLVGATTENPRYVLNAALLSRVSILTLRPLQPDSMEQLLRRAEVELSGILPISKSARNFLIDISNGDGRYILNFAEKLFHFDKNIDLEELKALLGSEFFTHSRNKNDYFNMMSALQKSIRGSNPDAALYWLARMLSSGEDPKYLIRRLIRISYEDIGLADTNAQTVSLTASAAFEKLGMPEGDLLLAQAAIYLSLAPKSNSVYLAMNKASQIANKSMSCPPPRHILPGSDEYVYDHDQQNYFSGQEYFPDSISAKTFYSPVERGAERDMKKRLDYFKKLRQEMRGFS